MKHILFILTSADRIGTAGVKTGYEFSEVANPYFEFVKAGFTVDFASPAGGTPPESSYDPMQENNKTFRQSRGFQRLGFSHKLDVVNTEAYDAVFFPGGLGPMVDLVDLPVVKEIVRRMYEGGAVVGAVCHGSVALLNVRLSNGDYLIDGKNISCFTGMEEKESGHLLGETIPFLLDEAIVKQGAKFSHAEPFQPYVLSHQRLVTGQNPASAARVAQEMITLILNTAMPQMLL